MSIDLQFQPVHALAGGAILGVATVGKLLLTGRVLGISGAFKGTITEGDVSPWRFAFLGGLVASGVLDAAFDPSQTAEPLPDMARVVLAGLLVGAGTGMGNGCTSGHGICGNSRFSVRSMAYTATFMAAGGVAASLFDTNKSLGVNSNHSALSNLNVPAGDELTKYAGILAVSAAAFVGLGALATLSKNKKHDGDDESKQHRTISLVTEALAGLVFGVGLTISGMRRAAKVSGFLSLLAPSFDPSLMLVMGGAMAVAIPGFQAANKKMEKPACERSFSIPKNKTIDRKLITGGVLFGLGWGLAGLCPGPAIVSAAAAPSTKLLAWLGSVALGMWGQHKLVK
jgi:uncharacterized membrane protein YedE/YeeE|tara:strand:- start:4979 stop:6001 length:1023 start_codon:yes stop_codon:yes gene_type:complete